MHQVRKEWLHRATALQGSRRSIYTAAGFSYDTMLLLYLYRIQSAVLYQQNLSFPSPPFPSPIRIPTQHPQSYLISNTLSLPPFRIPMKLPNQHPGRYVE